MGDLDKLIAAVEAGTFIQDVLPPRYELAAYGAFSGSLNAALWLHDAMVPDWRMDALWQGGTLCGNENDWSCRLRCISARVHVVENDERNALQNGARAWLLAILRAVKAQQSPVQTGEA